MTQDDSKLLVGTAATRYRSCTMRAQYLAQDRVDIAEAVKALSRNMSKPREGHVAEAKRLGRYLKGRDDLVQTFPVHRGSRSTLQVSCHVDSDWAGELVTRRSTSGAVVQINGHLVRHSSGLQTETAFSSAEAEYYAITKGACLSLGIQAYLRDLGESCELVIYTDSSSAKSLTERRGLGRMRHLCTSYPWVQVRLCVCHF